MADLNEQLRKRIGRTTLSSVLNRQLGLENIKRHSFENTTTGNKLGNASVKSGSVEDGRLNEGRPTLIPFLYKGRVVSAAEATDLAVASGRVWPSFNTNAEATQASIKISDRIGKEKRK